jgi:hypothetical protein
MEEYKSNSHKSRGDQNNTTELTPVKKKEVKQVTTTAKTKKKSLGSKLAQTFLPEDVTDVKEYVIWDVVIPTAKNVLLDTLNEVLGGGRRVRSSGLVISGNRRDYRGISTNRSLNGRRRSGFEYEDVIVDSSQEAHDVLDELDALMEQYQVVSLADLYSAAGISCDYTYNDYGWKDISDARVVRDPQGWLLKFPRAVPIK